MATHLKVGKPETLQDLAERAETYLEAHSSDILFGVDPKFSKIRGSLQPEMPQLWIYGSPQEPVSQASAAVIS